MTSFYRSFTNQFSNFSNVAIALFLCLFSNVLIAQKPIVRQSFEVDLDVLDETTQIGGIVYSKTSGFPTANYQEFFQSTQHSDPEAIAREYLTVRRGFWGLNAEDLENLERHAVRKSITGTTVRLRQTQLDLPVNQGEFTIHMNLKQQVDFVLSSFVHGVNLNSAQPAFNEAIAKDKAYRYIGLTGRPDLENVNLIISHVPGAAASRLMYRIVVEPTFPRGEWEILVDAKTGEIAKAWDITCYYHREKSNFHPPMSPPSSMVNGTGNVFIPDPLSSATVNYGGNYSDNNDANNTQLTQELRSVTLQDITFSGGMYELTGPYVQINESDLPTKGIFRQNSSTFNFNREDDAFEAVNCYYHLDESMRYMNETLNINVRPQSNNGVVRFDPHGWGGQDQSSFSGGSDRLEFGEGCVDDGEDSDVIHHELGHGIHDWVTDGGLSNNQGLSEGCGDYWAQSYNRSLNGTWNTNQTAYHYMFNWDGHNECWGGRTTNYNVMYTTSLGGLHTTGQIWATSLMLIYDEIGREKTDKIFLEGLGMTNSSANQNVAANAVYTAIQNLNGSTYQDIVDVHTILTSRGYTLPPAPSLPVDWLSFNGEAIKLGILLSWETTDEKDNQQFIIEKSDNGRDFDAIYSMKTQVADSQSFNYDFIDANPLNGINYYRIQQVDYDGKQSYSTVVTVDWKNDKMNWQITPNPLRGELNVAFQKSSTELLQYAIFTATGQQVLAKNWTDKNALENLNIDVTTLGKGIYYLQLQT
ncbi:MAG: T9SS type A sorting domain-containing protein, partial [Saprospiraceae bacterium]